MMLRMLLATTLLTSLMQDASAQSPLEGDYARDDFLRVLVATRSPVAAMRVGVPQTIRLDQLGTWWRFHANDNWHEGYTPFILKPDGSMERGEENLDYPRPRIDSSTHFSFHERPDAPWIGYTYVGEDVDTAILRCVLAGNYVEASGHRVKFGTDGMLRGLGRDTPYSLDNDHALGPKYDYFIRSKPEDFTGEAMGFSFAGNQLTLYKLEPATNGAMPYGEMDASTPLHVLRRLTPHLPCFAPPTSGHDGCVSHDKPVSEGWNGADRC